MWGDQTAADTGFFEELRTLETRLAGFRFLYCLSRETSLELIPAELRNYSRLGRINAVFEAEKAGFDLAATEFYLCGSRLVVDALKEYLAGVGVPKENIIFEKY